MSDSLQDQRCEGACDGMSLTGIHKGPAEVTFSRLPRHPFYPKGAGLRAPQKVHQFIFYDTLDDEKRPLSSIDSSVTNTALLDDLLHKVDLAVLKMPKDQQQWRPETLVVCATAYILYF